MLLAEGVEAGVGAKPPLAHPTVEGTTEGLQCIRKQFSNVHRKRDHTREQLSNIHRHLGLGREQWPIGSHTRCPQAEGGLPYTQSY